MVELILSCGRRFNEQIGGGPCLLNDPQTQQKEASSTMKVVTLPDSVVVGVGYVSVRVGGERVTRERWREVRADPPLC